MKTTLISVMELAALSPDDVLIVDCRFDLADPGKGARDYAAGHIPGAVYANLDTDLSDLSQASKGLGRHPLPSAATLSALLSRWGWRPGLQVVSYDAASGALAAARLWWLLRLADIRDVAVLDGSYAAWVHAALPLEQSAPARASSNVAVSLNLQQVVLDHNVLDTAARPLLLDARATARYTGEVEPIDPVGGHIPGAINHPFASNLNPDGRFKSAAALRQDFSQMLGTRTPDQVVHMCGSGVTACHNLLAMEHAGLSGSRLYAPSWSGWVSDPSRAVAKGV